MQQLLRLFRQVKRSLGLAEAALGRAVRSVSAVRAYLISASDNSPTEHIPDMCVCVRERERKYVYKDNSATECIPDMCVCV